MSRMEDAPVVWTLGHSSRPLDEFLGLLAEHRIEAVADVRRHPGSRRQPEYAQDALRASLEHRGIRYAWIEALGGRRRPHPDSHNTAWRHPSFRGYADYMESAQFAQGMDELLLLASEWRTAILCAEAVWWRCHRRLIADQLSLAGIEVRHILAARQCQAHPLAAPARIVRGKLSYGAPAAPGTQRA